MSGATGRKGTVSLSLLVALLVFVAAVAATVLPADAQNTAVGTAPVSVALSVPSPVTAGTVVPITASVTSQNPGGAVPSGSVQFAVDGQNSGSPVTLATGTAPFSISTLAVGTHVVTASYSGDGQFAPGDAGPGGRVVVVPAGASHFVPLTAVRILDTRPDGPQVGYNGAKPGDGSTVVLQVTGRGGVPAAGVTAVALNVTATEAGGGGYVTVYPADGARPLASNLNPETKGATEPNLVVVPVSAAGQVALFTLTSTHLIADVEGYFQAALTASAGRFVPVTPARALDTRPATQTGYSGAKPAAGATVTVTVAGRGGVPMPPVGGVVLNVTTVGSDSDGFVTAYPADQPRPLASNVNFVAHGTAANAVWVPLSADGKVNLFTASPSDLVVDVAGWFTTDQATDETTGLFVPVRPVRVLDTRPQGPQAGYSGPKPGPDHVVSFLGSTGTTSAAALVANVTATEASGVGFVTAYPDGVARPLASNINLERVDQTRPNLVTSPVGSNERVDLYTQSGAHLLADVAGWFTTNLDPPTAPTQHENYQPASGVSVIDPATVSAVTGDSTAGYEVALIAGAPRPAVGAGIVVKGGGTAHPDGLGGQVAKVVENADGTAAIVVTPEPLDQLFDNLDVGYDGPATLSIRNTGAPAARTNPAAAAPTQLPNDVVGASTTIDHSIIDFPAGAFDCTVGAGVTVSASLVRFDNTRIHFQKSVGLFTTPFVDLYITTEPIVTFSGDIHGSVTCSLSTDFQTTHRLVWVLPAAIPVTVDLTPAMQFSATIAGTVSFTEHMYRMVGFSTNPDLSIRTYNASSQTTEDVRLGPQLSASLLIGADVSVKLLDVAGIGLTLGPRFTASVDLSQCVDLTVGIEAAFDLRLNLWIKQFKYTFVTFTLGPWTMYHHCPGEGQPLSISTTALPNATVGKSYSATLMAIGGTPPYQWTIVSGSLPAGLQLSAASGAITGTPTTGGSATVGVQVRDHATTTATATFTLAVLTPSTSLSAVSCPSAGQCIAVGYSFDGVTTHSLIESLSGGSWTVVPSPAQGTGDDLFGVSCVDAQHCTAVGRSDSGVLVETLNGTTWNVEAAPGSGWLFGVSCVTAISCEAVGEDNSGATQLETLSNGSWTIPSHPALSGSLYAVSCPAIGSCVAVGDVFLGSGITTLVETLSGGVWTRTPSPNPMSGRNYLTGVSCPTAGSCFAVGDGDQGQGSQSSFISETLKNGQWVASVGPNPASGVILTENLSCATITSCVTGGAFIPGATTGGISVGTGSPFIETLTGDTWSVTPHPAESLQGTNLTGVSCPSATFCVAVGQTYPDALIEELQGGNWSIVQK
jgi:hypothetical protein